ncbi:uncharacterized protein [Drosophila pseudoobscura]|uniref:Gag-Pol polyprotein n=1 Tax=Drosophila pseudoobscura pseudoobscura TaxID=46245 RepID=A0A6I8WDW1_DROPS|nr:uncharacterized protein LOC117185494 [Drosophila pseudoobscura]
MYEDTTDFSLNIQSEQLEAPSKMALTLKDIRDSLVEFDGSQHKDINDWLTDFESTAETVQWNALQKFVYGRQLLKGAAKLFVNSQDGLTNWDTLKEALEEEFTEKLSAKQVHTQLENRKKKPNESLVEYFYQMKSLAKKSNLDEDSVIEYIIEGIPDTNQNRSVLYQAKDFKELRDKMKIYEKTSSNLESRLKMKFEKKEQNIRAVEPRCFKCGGKNHLAKDCVEKDIKCFKCEQLGHKANQCKVQKKDIKEISKPQQLVQRMYNRVFKDVRFGNEVISSLFDSGSDICTMSESAYKRAYPVPLRAQVKELVGIGGKRIGTLGFFLVDTELDGIPIEMCFHVVKDRDTLYSAVIGSDVLEVVSVTLGKKGVVFHKFEEVRDNEKRSEIEDSAQTSIAH